MSTSERDFDTWIEYEVCMVGTALRAVVRGLRWTYSMISQDCSRPLAVKQSPSVVVDSRKYDTRTKQLFRTFVHIVRRHPS